MTIKFLKIKSGYTLIELMVSIGILALLATATAPAISRAKRQQELQQAALGLKSKILEAQSLSLAPPSDNKSNQYYGLEFGNNVCGQTGFSYTIVKRQDATSAPGACDKNATDSFSTVTDNNSAKQFVWFKIGNTPAMTLENGDGTSWVDNNSGSGIIKITNGTQVKNITVSPSTGLINVTDI